MEHMVRFTAYIDETKRPKDFPKLVYSDLFFNVKSNSELKGYIKSMYQIFMAQQCLLVPKTAEVETVEEEFNYDDHMLVPMHMVTHIHTDTKKIIGEIPGIDDDGNPKLLDGTPVWRQ